MKEVNVNMYEIQDKSIYASEGKGCLYHNSKYATLINEEIMFETW